MGVLPERLVSPSQVARFLAVEVETLDGWRRRGVGPPWYRLGRVIRYRLNEVEDWIHKSRSQVANPVTSEQSKLEAENARATRIAR